METVNRVILSEKGKCENLKKLSKNSSRTNILELLIAINYCYLSKGLIIQEHIDKMI